MKPPTSDSHLGHPQIFPRFSLPRRLSGLLSLLATHVVATVIPGPAVGREAAGVVHRGVRVQLHLSSPRGGPLKAKKCGKNRGEMMLLDDVKWRQNGGFIQTKQVTHGGLVVKHGDGSKTNGYLSRTHHQT